MRCTLGVDIGTSSSKGVLVDPAGTILATATRAHDVSRPQSGWVEMDGRIWWDEFVELATDLLAAVPDAEVVGVGVSGMGPCVLLTDEDDEPVRPAILYGVDTRSTAQIERMTAELGVEEITRVGGSTLTSQAGGPKIAWVAEEEPESWQRARRLYMPASWLARRLTGAYVLDHQSASQVARPLVAAVRRDDRAAPAALGRGDRGHRDCRCSGPDRPARGDSGHHRHDRRLDRGGERRRP